MLTGTNLDLLGLGSTLRGIGLVIAMVYWGSAIAALRWAVRGDRSAKSKAWRGVSVALAFGFLPMQGIYTKAVNMRQFEAAHARFHELCYGEAHERIFEKPHHARTIIMNPASGPRGGYGFDLFYGGARPSTWGSMPVLPAGSPATDGSIEVRYTDEPVKFGRGEQEVLIHRVRIEVIEPFLGKVLAERVDFLMGSDFNRANQCLASTWYKDNDAFLERVLGARYTSGLRNPWQTSGRRQSVQARLVSTEDVDKTLKTPSTHDIVPGVYDYGKRTIRLPGGAFQMLLYRNAEPVPIIAVLEQEDRYVFLMLPHGELSNWPLRVLLVQERKKDGEEIASTFVQIPPGLDWRDGWGFERAEARWSQRKLQFTLYGNKAEGEAHLGSGRYGTRYAYEVALPEGD